MEFRKIIDKLLTLKPIHANAEGKSLTFKLNTYTAYLSLYTDNSVYRISCSFSNLINGEIHWLDGKIIDLTEIEYSEYLLKFNELYNIFKEDVYNELLEAIKEQTLGFDRLLDTE